MATSQKTFEQVKSILGKLDSRIDAVRNRRVHGEPAPVVTNNQPTGTQPVYTPNSVIGGSHQPPAPIPMPTPPAAVTPPASSNGHPKYGRAVPLRNIG